MEDCGFKTGMNIAVVGLGLIGGSYAMALKKHCKCKVIGIDRNKDVVGAATELGVIDRGYTCEQTREALQHAELVIVALYPKDTVEFVKNNLDAFKHGAVITDTCGIKADIIEEISSFLPEHLDFVGGHPMAGREAEGFSAATADLFEDSNYIITPVQTNKYENIKVVEKLAKVIGCKNVSCITPGEHDRIISFTSQLPHVIAISLMNSNSGVNINNIGSTSAEGNLALFTGGSFRDATRVANLNSTLWSQLFTLNAENLLKEIERFEDSIRTIKKAIEAGDGNKLAGILGNVSAIRRKMV